MLERKLLEKDYLPLWDGGMTAEEWPARRAELKGLLEKYCYGHMPDAPESVQGIVMEEDNNAYAGKAVQRRVMLVFGTPQGEFRFPVVLVIPKDVPRPAVLLHLSFRRVLPDRYVPVEEIIDNGFALAVACYLDIAPDSHDGDFETGLCQRLIVLNNHDDRGSEEPGRIGVWAWGASRVLDWLYTLDEVDAAHTAVIGHSRLGKTALWAAAEDERFWCAISNCSGFGGAACAKNGHGERVADFIRAGSWDWYCERFKNDLGKEDERVFDQHYLLALIAPRLLCVGSAEQDRGADPEAEFLTSLTASKVWEMLGRPGLVCPDRMPVAGDAFGDGDIHYHLRAGTHFLSRTDWCRYMDFLKRKLR